MPDDRPYDIVLFGATGFTGALTAEYLARNAGPGCRWALAGRDRGRLEAVRERLGLPGLPLLHADAGEPASLDDIARRARVVATTVGPYLAYGEPLVAACARAGTHYADLTGEPEFVDLMYVRHHARAQESGAKIVHACGFDSIPYDLGVHFTVGLLPKDVPIRIDGYVRGTAGRRAGPCTRPSRSSRAPRRPRGPPSTAAGPRSAPPGAGPAGCPAPSATWAAGRCRCPRSTRRSSAARPGPWSATARTSSTGTTWPSSTWAAPSAWPPGPGRWPSSRRSRPRAPGCSAGSCPAPGPPRAAGRELVQGHLRRAGRR
nr:hypothetical protein GCM10020093_024040 [Planobispora longispora]